MRLLVLSAGAGAGHNRAAEALHATARERFPDVASEWTDSLRFTSRLFRTMYAESYVWMATYSPTVWGMLYALQGRKQPASVERAIKTFDKLAYRKLKEYVAGFAPDAIVCTHFLPMNVTLAMKDPPPVYVAITDFDVHSAWVNRAAAGYFVGSEEVRWQLQRFGIPGERIRVTGIPIVPEFTRTRGRDAILRELRPPRRAPLVLLMGGGFGMGNIEEAVERVLAVPKEMLLYVICGRNEKLRARVEKAAAGAGDRVRVFGFVTNMHDLMEAADLVITKAGGLTVSEGLARGTPMVIFMPIPGQEERNTDYLLEHGAAVKAKGVETLDYKVKELLEAPSRLAKMRQAAQAIARPWAAQEIIGFIRGQARE